MTTSFEAIVEKVPYSVQLVTPSGNITYCNLAGRSAYGVTESEDILQYNLKDFHPDFQPDGKRSDPETAGYIAKALHGEPTEFNWVYKRKDGEEFLAHVMFQPFQSEEPTILATFTISDERASEYNTHEHISCDKMEQIIEHAPSAICTFSRELMVLSVNTAFESISGISRDELQNNISSSYQLSHASSKIILAAFETGEIQHEKILENFPSGVRRLRKTAIPIKQGPDVTEVAVSYIDDTALVEEVREFRTVIDKTISGFYHLDTNLDFIKCNNAFLNIIGSSREELLHTNLNDLTFLKYEGKTAADVLTSKEIAHGSVSLSTPHGIIHGELHHIPIINDNGEVIKIGGEFVDNTDSLERLAYLQEAISGVVQNLTNLSQGELEATILDIPANKYTEEIQSKIQTIEQEFIATQNTLNLVMGGVTAFVQTCADGRIRDANIDLKDYNGVYLTIAQKFLNFKEIILLPLCEIYRVLNNLSNCDFTTRINENVTFRGEWSNIKKSLNETCAHVQEGILLVHKTVDQLNSVLTETVASTGDVLDSASIIVDRMDTLKVNMASEKESINQLTLVISDVADTISDISERSAKLSALASSADNLAKSGKSEAQEADLGMQVITRSTDDVSRLILNIQNEMQHIGKIVDIITEIAGQTNLLALNAAIEAARAGDAGRGFAVVAAEVKNLAEQSRKSAKNIQEMIASLTSKSKAAVDAMNCAQDAVQDGSKALTHTLAVFNDMAERVDDISRNVEVIASMSEEQAAAIQEISGNIEDIKEIISSNLAEVTETALATQETQSALQKMKDTTEHMHKLGEELSTDISKFTV